MKLLALFITRLQASLVNRQRVLGVVLIGLGLQGCTHSKTNQSHTLVVLVEGLSFQSVECEEERYKKYPFLQKLFCEESSRLTHLFANATQRQANFATLISGRDIEKHKVQNNGNNKLSSSYQTVAEEALENGYQTILFSDRPNLLKKSGLLQGFENFESLSLSKHPLTKPVTSKIIDKYLKWKNSLWFSKGFAVIYLSDFINPFLHLESTGEGDRKWFWESIEKLISLTTKDTNIFLLGFSGDLNLDGRNRLFNDNLFSENTHMSGFVHLVQPVDAKKYRGKLMSFIDIGKWLSDLMSNKLWSGPSEKVNQLGGWQSWQGIGPITTAVRSDSSLKLYNGSFEQAYDTLADPGEVEDLSQGLRRSKISDVEAYYLAHEFSKVVYLHHKEGEIALSGLVDRYKNSSSEFVKNWLSELQGAYRSTNHGDHRCRDFFKPKSNLKDFFRKCRDADLYAVIKWTQGDEPLFNEVKKYFKQYTYRRQIKKWNALFYFNWDLDEPLNLSPSLSDMYLSREENLSFRKRLGL